MTLLRQFVDRHPFVITWIALAIGMVAILLWAARDAGLLPGQLAFLVAVTVVLAGACVWIITWE